MLHHLYARTPFMSNFRHYYQSFGGWPWYMKDYWNHGIMERIDSPSMGEVIYDTDPYGKSSSPLPYA